MADVWMKYCTRQARCKWCEEPILNGSPMVMVKIWKGKEGIERKYTITLRFHPDCWIKQAMANLDKEPPPTRKLPLSEEDSKTRKRLIRKYATTKHRLKVALDGGNYTGYRIDKLMCKLWDIRNQIELVGGVPKEWPELKETTIRSQ